MKHLSQKQIKAFQFLIIPLVCASFFAIWFKKTQLGYVHPSLVHFYPKIAWLEPVLVSYLILLLAQSIDLVWICFLASKEKRLDWEWINLSSYFVFLFPGWGGSIRITLWCHLFFKGIIFLILFLKSKPWKDSKFSQHLYAFLLILLLHIVFNSFLSPLRWKDPINALDLHESAVDSLNNGSHRPTYVNAKLFDFSGFDHANWAALVPPLVGRSQLLAAVTFLADLPSIDVKTMLRTSMAIAFFSCVLGSFGFFCYCLHALKFEVVTALIGSFLYVIGNSFIAESITQYFPFYFSFYLFLPWAMLFCSLGLAKQKGLLLCLGGMALALNFYVMQSHPEAIINGTLFFTAFWGLEIYLYKKSIRDRLIAFALPYSTLGICSLLIYLPLVEVFWHKDVQIVGHQDPMLCLWGIKYSINIIKPFLIAVLPLYGLLFFIEKPKTITKEPRFIFFTLLAIIIAIPTLPGRSGPFVPWAEKLNLFKSINLYVPSRVWVYLYLSSLIAGLFCVNGLLRQPFPKKLFLAFYSIALFLLSLWKFKGYFAHHRLETQLLVVWLIPTLAFLFRTSKKYHQELLAILCPFSLCLVVLFQAGALGWPNLAEEKNPEHCLSYISTRSLLTKYEALAADAQANKMVLRDHLNQFENATGPNHFPLAYKEQLGLYKVASVTQVSDSQLHWFTMDVADIVDKYYFSGEGGCLYGTEKTYGWGKGMWHNLSALFYPIATKHYQSMDATGLTHHYGVAEGLILNDATNIFDGAFMAGYGPLYALYVAPGNSHTEASSFATGLATNLFYGVEETLLNPHRRKIYQISGIDTYTIFSRDLTKLQGIKDIEIISQDTPNVGNEKFSLVHDLKSYGIVYLAKQIHYVSPDINTLNKFPMPIHRKATLQIPQFKEKVAELDSLLMGMKERGEIYLEDSEKMGQTGLAAAENTLAIENILASKAAFTVHCERTPCTVVYNMANTSGWTAYSDKVELPIKQANFAFMAVDIPQGTHLVWFEHNRKTALWGILFSLVAMIATLQLSARKLIRSQIPVLN